MFVMHLMAFGLCGLFGFVVYFLDKVFNFFFPVNSSFSTVLGVKHEFMYT